MHVCIIIIATTLFPVASAPATTCGHTGFVKLGLDEGYISSVVGSKTGCGLQKTPWVIQVGQTGCKRPIQVMGYSSSKEFVKGIAAINGCL